MTPSKCVVTNTDEGEAGKALQRLALQCVAVVMTFSILFVFGHLIRRSVELQNNPLFGEQDRSNVLALLNAIHDYSSPSNESMHRHIYYRNVNPFRKANVAAGWDRCFSNWTFTEYSHDEADSLVETTFPWMKNYYGRLRSQIRKEIALLLFLYVHGGIYMQDALFCWCVGTKGHDPRMAILPDNLRKHIFIETVPRNPKILKVLFDIVSAKQHTENSLRAFQRNDSDGYIISISKNAFLD